MSMLFGDTAWVLVLLSTALGLGGITAVVGWTYDIQRARLPEATRYNDLVPRVKELEEKITALNGERRRLDQAIQDRDRKAAEILALEERIHSLKAEFAGLSGAEQQINDMKRLAAEAAESYSVARAELDGVRQAREEADRGAQSAENRLANARREIELTEEQVRAVTTRFVELEAAVGQLQTDRARLERDVAGLGDQQARLVATQAETAGLETRKASLGRDIERIEERLSTATALLTETQQASRRMEDERAAVAQSVAELRGERERLEAARSEMAELLARREALHAQIGALEERQSAALARIEEIGTRLRTLADEKTGIEREIAELDGARAALWDARAEEAAITARIAAAKQDLETIDRGRSGRGADGQTGAATGNEVDRELRDLPVCLATHWPQPHPVEQEAEALYRVTEHLQSLKLSYDKRTVLAFHTALKINDAAQLAVLAGVSGTGKSLLPRRYAEAMGIRFLQIAVEPRWDSPQDLLGFYNYIEKGYRATDLARALVHMDPHQTADLEIKTAEDQMLLVLLDEMNLARVEYYFSEFLSRLEIRPRFSRDLDREQRLGASLPLDLPGRSKGPVRLFPSHNVLFVGTMNDDESTQSLSDKVLDRSNVLQFAAPTAFGAAPDGGSSVIEPRYRRFSQWRSWVKDTDALEGGDRHKAKAVVAKLASVLEQMGRPFGHRLSDAIFAYAANYPRGNGDAIDVPLADQIEMRILPKLRGLAIDEHQQSFEDIDKLIREDLHDRDLADRLRGLVERQGQGTGQFNWRGYNRSGG